MSTTADPDGERPRWYAIVGLYAYRQTIDAVLWRDHRAADRVALRPRFEEFGGRCALCGSAPHELAPALLEPLWLDHELKAENVVPLCLSCVERKGDLLLLEMVMLEAGVFRPRVHIHHRPKVTSELESALEPFYPDGYPPLQVVRRSRRRHRGLRARGERQKQRRHAVKTRAVRKSRRSPDDPHNPPPAAA